MPIDRTVEQDRQIGRIGRIGKAKIAQDLLAAENHRQAFLVKRWVDWLYIKTHSRSYSLFDGID